jgi:hypothetical protein
MIKIIRIEDEAGVGMYYSNYFPYEISSSSSVKHPMPWQDSGLSSQGITSHAFLWAGSTWRFGFASFEQARAWLYNDDWLRALNRNFRVVIYEVENEYCNIGNSQTMFYRDFATEIECYGVCEYFNVELRD